MDDVVLVRRVECVGNLSRDVQRLVERNRALGDAIRERRTVHQFHDERAYAIGLFEAVDRRDIGMVERGEDVRLTLEARQSVGVQRERIRQDLDCHVTLQLRVACAIHFAHAAGAKQTGDLIRTEAAARWQGHGDVARIIHKATPSGPGLGLGPAVRRRLEPDLEMDEGIVRSGGLLGELDPVDHLVGVGHRQG